MNLEMLSVDWCLVFVIAIGIVPMETLAASTRNWKVIKKRDIWSEAIAEWKKSGGELSFNLAPSYGDLDSESLQYLDNELKVMISEVIDIVTDKTYSWDELLKVMNQNPSMERAPSFQIAKLEKISFSSTRLFGAGSDKSERIKKIESWFTRLIGNVDILKDTDINLKGLVKMVSKISVGIAKNLWSKIHKKKKLMDQGILRFPDISQPFFSLYRINLYASCHYRTFIIRQKEKCSIVGFFQREVYFPNRDYIKRLPTAFTEKILDEVNELFSDL